MTVVRQVVVFFFTVGRVQMCLFPDLLQLTGKCPVSPALEGGVKGHNIKGKYLTGKPCPLGRGASLKQYFSRKMIAILDRKKLK